MSVKMSDWKDILKESRLTSRTGIRTKLGTTPLTMGDEDDFPCCEEAREQALSLMQKPPLLEHQKSRYSRTEINNIQNADCEDLFWTLDSYKKSSPRAGWEIIIGDWQKCIFEQGIENPEHDEQRGWYVDYKEV